MIPRPRGLRGGEQVAGGLVAVGDHEERLAKFCSNRGGEAEAFSRLVPSRVEICWVSVWSPGGRESAT